MNHGQYADSEVRSMSRVFQRSNTVHNREAEF
jgi:hypothetical protein